MTVLLKDISVSFGATKALNDIVLRLNPAELVAVVGLNGAGKSTLLRVLAGLQKPTTGLADIPDSPGWCPQDFALWPELTAREHMFFLARLGGTDGVEDSQRITTLLNSNGLSDAADRPVSGYSGGMKRRLSLAVAQLNSPVFLILDEPDAGLDIDGLKMLRSRARELADQGVSVVLATHDVAAMENFADRVLVLRNGELVADASPDALLERLGKSLSLTIDIKNTDALFGILHAEHPNTDRSDSRIILHDNSLWDRLPALLKTIEPHRDLIRSFRVELAGLERVLHADLTLPGATDFTPIPLRKEPPRNSVFSHFQVLSELFFTRQGRDPLSFSLTLATPSFFAVFFYGIVEQEDAFQAFVPRLAVFSAIMLIFSTSLVVSREFEARTVDRLRLSGVHVLSYVFAVLSTQTSIGIFSLFALYGTSMLLGFDAAHHHMTYLSIFVVTAVSCSSVGIGVASLARNVPRAFVFASFVMFLMLLFSGIVFPAPDVLVLNILSTYHAVQTLNSLAATASQTASGITLSALVTGAYVVFATILLRPRWKTGGYP